MNMYVIISCVPLVNRRYEKVILIHKMNVGKKNWLVDIVRVAHCITPQ